MNWYYVENGQQRGPVTEADLGELARSGKIEDSTLVWKEGQANWRPYAEIKSGSGNVPPTLASTGPGDAVCSQCGKVFPADDVVRLGDSLVCASCKPLYVQRMKEGVLPGGAMEYAGFWTRFCAVFVDGIILWVVNLAFALAAGLSFGRAVGVEQADGVSTTQVILFILQASIGALYEVIMIGKFGATVGKMVVKIRVVTADGGRVSYSRAIGRYFAKLLSSLACGIGFIMAGFDAEKRALHDRICGTRVIKKS